MAPNVQLMVRKKQVAIALFKEEISIQKIAKKLNFHHSMVYRVIK